MSKNLEKKAKQELGFIPTSGIDGLGKEGRKALQYGLKKGLFTQDEVNAAQEQYREHSAKQELGFIPTSGIDGLGKKGREALLYGLTKGLFTQDEVTAAQEKYKASHSE